ncbi:hypothetical protein B0H17DRAFT_1188838 [Mycena rosella]|uniref:Neutral/alkaline non-lysosomal ceramidase N-terminal domain-containing protein n=1 Tax=Mycena rosella TaxID=1033263 RepID=A0AAD7BC04_MYCRO|nr:hypothetical protein B0H17DRAFT_1188838 [Mycena rosella]
MAFQTTAGLIDKLEAAGAYNLNGGHRAGRIKWGSIWRRLHYRLTSENRPSATLNLPTLTISYHPTFAHTKSPLTNVTEIKGPGAKKTPQGVPSARPKARPWEKKANTIPRVWEDAAPAGPRPKVSQDFPDPDPVLEAPRKRAASNVQQLAKAKAPRIRRSEEAVDNDDNDNMASKKRVTKTVVDSDHDGKTEIVPARPQPKPKAQPKMKSKGKVALAPVHIDAEDAGFTDEEDDHSDPAMGAADEEDKPDKDADNLQGLAADEVEQRLAHSVPQWSSNHDKEDFPMLSRPSSHASFSSGHYSVPESNFDGKPIEVSSDSDSDSDTGLRGALSRMRAARDSLPAPTKIITTSRHESQKPAKGYATLPYAWSLSTVDIQMFKVGNLVMLIILEELTIMAGRRLPCEHLRALHHHARGVRCPAVRGASTIFGPSSTSTSTQASCLSSWTHPLSRTPPRRSSPRARSPSPPAWSSMRRRSGRASGRCSSTW